MKSLIHAFLLYEKKFSYMRNADDRGIGQQRYCEEILTLPILVKESS